MNHKMPTTLLLMAGIAVFSFDTAAAKEDFPKVTEDGLHLVEGSRMAVVYADPEADLAPYVNVIMLEPYVAFRKNWERDQRRGSAHSLRVTSNDVKKIKDNLAKEFEAVFAEELTNGGFGLVTEAAEDALLIRPAIINLDVNAPDTPTAGRSRTYTDSAGEMTLYIELYDSITGDLIAKALDRRVDRSRSGYYTWTNSVTNRSAAMKILKGWAEILVRALQEAKSNPSDSP